MFGLPNLYLVLGGAILVGILCLSAYHKGREACRVEVATEMRKAFEKEMEAREERHKKDVEQASKTTEVIRIVKEKGEEKIRYVEKLVKENPTPMECRLGTDPERMRLLSEIADATERTANSK